MVQSKNNVCLTISLSLEHNHVHACYMLLPGAYPYPTPTPFPIMLALHRVLVVEEVEKVFLSISVRPARPVLSTN